MTVSPTAIRLDGRLGPKFPFEFLNPFTYLATPATGSRSAIVGFDVGLAPLLPSVECQNGGAPCGLTKGACSQCRRRHMLRARPLLRQEVFQCQYDGEKASASPI